ncbi:lytic transglycosylase domain-containing protein [Luteimonas sp. MC1895]|uniref:lytic transglycosylase domain-containing protein n=1 Tax=Luteimonas sp. MC1895 TaxID=2819513 RepID=UPI0018F0787F|nr:lytic transglycosylase domain-containing protein [Luteimonas sp. MC1895]MBJ6979909.1 lytic transglycosylase domain-containing protein [Luteimonas sp. MC1895]
MLPPTRFLLSAALAACLLPPAAASAQARPDDDLARRALTAAEIGQPVPPLRADHPLQGWVGHARLNRDIATLAPGQALEFLDRHRGQAVARTFRAAWLAELAKRRDWTSFRAAWEPGTGSAALACNELEARLRTGAADATWTAEVQQLWRGAARSQPDACDPVFDALAGRGGLGEAERWARIEAAITEGQPGVVRSAARGLPDAQRRLAEAYAAYLGNADASAVSWPKDARSRLAASHGLAALAGRNPDAAESLLPQVAQALQFTAAERNRVLYQVALWTVASYHDGGARRLAAVPEAAYDERLHEWRVREAMARSDWRAALAGIERMGRTQRTQSRWAYFEARLRELTGDRAAARPLYAAAARDADFHGFLAADRIDQPYALCPLEHGGSAADKAAVAADPAMQRAMTLFRVNRAGWATREWQDALSRFNDRQRQIAVEIAQDNGWFDRGVFGLVNVGGERKPEELRLYTLRFPLHHQQLIRGESARNGLDAAWVAAEIRAESTFNPRARSPANARGLMQVLPETGAAVARRLGIPWSGADALFDPATNVRIGTAYLREMKEKYTLPYVAIAAYNAGPTPTARWQAQRPGMDPGFWIETISYKETRDYVARVLAFSVIYDWRLGDRPVAVSDRMHGRVGATRKAFACPAAAAAAVAEG